MTKVIIPEGYYSEEQVAGFLGKTIPTLRADHCHRRNRVPPKTKLGRVIIYSKASFKEWLEAREVKHFELRSKQFKSNS
ncbi:MAG: hypothetical protein V4694_01015 [Pseudomonadota bacterium]